MLARRLPLLLAFAAGSLGTALAGFGLDDGAPLASPRSHHASERTLPPASPPSSASDARDHLNPSDHASGPAAAPDDEPATEAGNSVADVLMRLEESYREALATRTPDAKPEPRVERDPIPPPVTPVAVEKASVAPPTNDTPKLEAAPAPVSRTPAPVQVAQSDARANDLHIGDVHQNIYLGSVHQGDLLQVQQLHQAQQLAILQYMQLIALSGNASAATRRGHDERRVAPQRPRPFSMPLTNPDNPWGFDFPPTVLVK